MPYIPSYDREKLLLMQNPVTAGELNYMFTVFATRYLAIHGLKYETLNAIVGAFESAKAEFQRRVVAPYEDKKIQENGDVYPTA